MTTIEYKNEIFTVVLYETAADKPLLREDFQQRGILAQAFCSKGKSRKRWMFLVFVDGTTDSPTRIL